MPGPRSTNEIQSGRDLSEQVASLIQRGWRRWGVRRMVPSILIRPMAENHESEEEGRLFIPAPMRYIVRSVKLMMVDDGARARSVMGSPANVGEEIPGGGSKTCPYM